jgi:NTE family protein
MPRSPRTAQPAIIWRLDLASPASHQGGDIEKLGLVLSGGGARSAYQVGVLKGIHKISVDEKIESKLKFSIIAGTSGGAINGAHLACHADDFGKSCDELWEQWENLNLSGVVKTNSWPIINRALRLVTQLGSGGRQLSQNVVELLDTKPLAQMLLKRLDFHKMRRNLDEGHIYALALTATHYGTGTSVTFFEGAPDITEWKRSNRIGLRTKLRVKHVLGSSAIPILFPPAKIRGNYYGDGAIRLSAPMSPAIHLGADRVLAIGVRYWRSPEETVEINRTKLMESIQFADITGVIMNSIFLDAIDADLERMERINRTLTKLPDKNNHAELRPIPVLAIRPSVDLAILAKDQLDQFSGLLKHMLGGLGAANGHGNDLVSYLAFEKSYTSRLLKLGLSDALAQKKAILDWLNSPIS